MQIKTNNLNARLYRFFYGELENNFCVFFRNLILMYILIIPFAVISIPIMIFEKMKNKSLSCLLENTTRSMLIYITIFLIIICLLPLRISSIPLGRHIHNFLEFSIACGIAFDIILFCALLAFISNKLVEYFKAKKNNYCPKIEWID